MPAVEDALRAETEKWLTRLEALPLGKHPDRRVEEQLVNVRAYLADSRHFLRQGDLVRAFEAVIYAWGIFETLERLGLLKKQGKIPGNY
ncbi:MAG: DUF357 domain-containing protein [Candidatus Aenigmarchaeota archaeon]|nr:DUF357 domain-containing protein [Candidatus Aenigmarchaeota archaeon]